MAMEQQTIIRTGESRVPGHPAGIFLNDVQIGGLEERRVSEKSKHDVEPRIWTEYTWTCFASGLDGVETSPGVAAKACVRSHNESN